MPRRARVVTWNGKDVPPELRDLPAGRFFVEAVEKEAPALSPGEEAGWTVPFRIYYQRHPDELLIVRVYHQARRPITR